MKIRVLSTLILVVSLLLVACGGGPQKPTSPPSPKATSTPVAPPPTNTPAAVQPTATAAAEEYHFDQAADLSGLNSYRTHYTFKWESIKAGQKETGSWDVLAEFVRQPPAHRFVWASTGAGAEDKESKLELIQIGQQAYMNAGSGWMAMTTTEMDIFKGNPFLSDPFNVVSGNRGKLVERNVMVNGVSTNHYVFDESTLGATLGLGAIATAKGDVWVSPEFNVVVKYAVHYEGKNLAIGGGDEGVLDLAFDLTDINKPITIQAPAGVKPAMPEDIPVMDGATELTAVSGVVSYQTTKSVEEVTAFYEAQMPAQGWAKGEGGIPGMLSFTKGGRTAQIIIQGEAGKTTVTILTGGQ